LAIIFVVSPSALQGRHETLVKKGKLDIQRPVPVPEWQNADDPRGAITLDQLLRMSGGLEFNEAYAPFSDAANMFYDSYDFAADAARKKLEAPPDTNPETGARQARQLFLP
jgi:CubicO group peptidase (beta-lactamase class C family)